MLDMEALPARSSPPEPYSSGQGLFSRRSDDRETALARQDGARTATLQFLFDPPRPSAAEPASGDAPQQELQVAMSFSEAVAAMKAGKAVRRACGRRMFVFMAEQGQRFSDALGCTVFIQPDDVLATNWEIAGDAFGGA